MKRIELEFSRRGPRGRWLGVGLFAVAALATAKLMDIRAASLNEAALLEIRIARLERRANGVPEPQVLAEETRAEIRRANEVIDQITVPWKRLFGALEAASSSKVALLGITPDPEGGTVEISAECADLPTMFDYVKRLDRQPSLGRVYLLHHQIDAQGPHRVVRFKVTASWMPAPSRT
jgi:hypothetical protein